MSPAILNDLWLQFGLAGWKPAAAALLLPPVPLVGLMCCGALLVRRRPIWGWLLLMAGAVGIWLSCTVALGDWLERQLLYPSRPLVVADLQRLQAASRGAPTTAIVILGSGRESHAPEYGAPNLPPLAMERLRYGIWLSRQTGLPLAFSGGTGHALVEGPSEAEVAAQIAQRDFGRMLKWTESSSRDTRDNARRTLALLRPAGIQRIVLVTHGWHMRRSLRAFEQAAAQGGGIELVAAPMGLAVNDVRPLLRWLPGLAGFTATYHALREYLGLWVGA
jgi:uncharacterized SAM-binding protein YcdF (DUF218 family)